MTRIFTVGHGLPLMLRKNRLDQDPEIRRKRMHLQQQRRLYLAELQRPHLLRVLDALREDQAETTQGKPVFAKGLRLAR